MRVKPKSGHRASGYRRIDRRMMLRGAGLGTGVALGLPLLGSMLNDSGTAHADESALRKMFGVWFCGNGIEPSSYLPQGTGANWRIPNADQRLDRMRLIEPENTWGNARKFYQYPEEEHAFSSLLDIREHFSLVSGLKIDSADRKQHVLGQTTVLSGRYWKGGNFGGPSIDQIVAKKLGSTSLVMRVFHDRKLKAARLMLNQSWAEGPTGLEPVEPFLSAMDAFKATFTGANSAAGDAKAEGEAMARQSVLDHVGGQLKTLQSRVGSSDSARLEQHFTSLRELEASVGRAAACDTEIPNEVRAEKTVHERHQGLVRVAALALACGAHDAFNLSFSRASDFIILPVTKGVGVHKIQHRGFLGDGTHGVEKIRAAIRREGGKARNERLSSLQQKRVAISYQMARFAELVRHFASVPHGAGTLLDACSILGTFEKWDGVNHGFEETPLIVAGTANGALKLGEHIRDEKGTIPGEVVLSSMRAVVGAEKMPSFGKNEGRVRHEAINGYSAIEA